MFKNNKDWTISNQVLLEIVGKVHRLSKAIKFILDKYNFIWYNNIKNKWF